MIPLHDRPMVHGGKHVDFALCNEERTIVYDVAPNHAVEFFFILGGAAGTTNGAIQTVSDFNALVNPNGGMENDDLPPLFDHLGETDADKGHPILNQRTLLANILQLGDYDVERTVHVFSHFVFDLEAELTADTHDHPPLPRAFMFKLKAELRGLLDAVMANLSKLHSPAKVDGHKSRLLLLFGMSPEKYPFQLREYLTLVLRMTNAEDAAVALWGRVVGIAGATDNLAQTKVVQEIVSWLLAAMKTERADVQAIFLLDLARELFSFVKGQRSEIQRRLENSCMTSLTRRLHFRTRVRAKQCEDPDADLVRAMISDAAKGGGATMNLARAALDAYTIIATTKECPNTIEAYLFKTVDALRAVVHDNTGVDDYARRKYVLERACMYLYEVVEHLADAFARIHGLGHGAIFLALYHDPGLDRERLQQVVRFILVPEESITEDFFQTLANSSFIKFHVGELNSGPAFANLCEVLEVVEIVEE